MPPKRETPTQRSARLALASAALTLKADKQLVLEVMKTAPASVAHLKRCLLDHGFIDELGECRTQSLAESTALRCTGSAATSPAGNHPFSPAQFSTSDKIPKGMCSVAACSADFLLFLLEQIEPRGFSKSSMRGMLKPKQRKHSRSQLVGLAEYTF